ncbi:hypothetical protein, partial [Staphylococcus equorum]|uniref:hypothetical protein n=1 Tax=Staphylococcus equorum TaxID=246432 RepID=UPI001C7103BD
NILTLFSRSWGTKSQITKKMMISTINEVEIIIFLVIIYFSNSMNYYSLIFIAINASLHFCLTLGIPVPIL